MMKKNGYTFMELLVVITIMVLLGAGILLQQNLIKEDNVLTQAAADLQSFIRLAQSNATTAVLCEGEGTISWIIEPTLNNKQRLNLKCKNASSPQPIQQKTFVFGGNIEIAAVLGASGCNANFPSQNLQIIFATLSSKPTFDSPIPCVKNSTTFLDFIVKNSKTSSQLTVTIDLGGTVDVK